MACPSEELKLFGAELGFQSIGIARAGSATSISAYDAWLAHGFHGEMTYLARHRQAKTDPRLLLDGAESVIAVALNYAQPSQVNRGQPRIARYALGRDYHKVLRTKLKRLAGWISSRHPGSTSRICVDSAPVLEREFANRAGLGWFGKNTCLIDSRRGSWFFIGILLTTAEFEPDEPSAGSCGACKKCIEACPTGAIVQVDARWQVDARRCISYLTIEKRSDFSDWETRAIGNWTFGCDICQEVCPFNAERGNQPLRAAVTDEADFVKRKSWPNLVELAQMGPADWDRITRGSPLRRAGLAGLRRNVRANVENDVSDGEVRR